MFGIIFSFVASQILYFALHLESSSFPKPLSARDEIAAFEAMKNGDMAARDKLIRHNLRLVAHIVKKYYASSTDQEDLISIGTIGLIKAVNSFDNTKGARFATYAARCIENEVLMQFRAGKKSQNDVSIQEPIDSDKDGNSLTLNDVVADTFDVHEDYERDRGALPCGEPPLRPGTADRHHALRPFGHAAADTAAGGGYPAHQPQLCIPHREKSAGRAARNDAKRSECGKGLKCRRCKF